MGRRRRLVAFAARPPASGGGVQSALDASTHRDKGPREHLRDFAPRHHPGELPGLVGTHTGYTAWQELTQERVNQFADATDDHQWIHVDVERAKQSPFGGTIAHGFLTLSLVAPVTQELLDVTDATPASTTASIACASRRRCRSAVSTAAAPR